MNITKYITTTGIIVKPANETISFQFEPTQNEYLIKGRYMTILYTSRESLDLAIEEGRLWEYINIVDLSRNNEYIKYFN